MIGVDLTFNGYPSLGYLEEKIYDGSNLEYADDTFDFVISVDMLEHVPKSQRGNIISEMLRIAKTYMILAFPTSGKSLVYEEKLERRYTRYGLPVPKYLKEHMQCGLPDENEIMQMIKRNLISKNISQHNLTVLPNENLKLWYLHEFFRSKGAVIFYSAMFVIKLLLCIMLFLASIGECYRKIIIVEKR